MKSTVGKRPSQLPWAQYTFYVCTPVANTDWETMERWFPAKEIRIQEKLCTEVEIEKAGGFPG